MGRHEKNNEISSQPQNGAPTPLPFRARAHLLKLLGDELIGDDRLAVFELVKNSYDACATHVTVKLDVDNNGGASISITDNGFGMTRETIEKVWLEIGTPNKRSKAPTRIRPCMRLPLGEKGVGRLAAHKLGTRINMVTRAADSMEQVVDIDWPELIEAAEYIENTQVVIKEREPEIFTKRETGVALKITGLHRADWSRRDIRSLKRMISTLISPFQSVDDFSVTLEVPGKEDWLKDIFEPGDILDRAIWKLQFNLSKDGQFSWNYEFSPPAMENLEPRKDERQNDCLELLPPDSSHKKKRTTDEDENLYLKSGELKGIGSISGFFYIFDRRPILLRKFGQTQQIKDYLDEQTGIRIYRDGIRVYNYGEPSDDWLGLNAGRINRPAEKMGTNSVIAAINLGLECSTGLKEKTNREGFDENDNYLFFRRVIRSVVAFLDAKRLPDRRALDQSLKTKDSFSHEETFHAAINSLKNSAHKHKLDEELKPYIETIEREYAGLQEVMASSGVAGLGLAMVYHEIEREVEGLEKAITLNEGANELRERVAHLVSLLDGFSPLLKKSEQKTVWISKIIERAKAIHQQRFAFHGVIFSCPILTGEEKDFQVTGAINLFLGAISNLIDNAIYWSRKKSERPNENNPSPLIYITTITDWYDGPAIVVADNGPGFTLNPDEATKPFVSQRLGGMGLGLYYARLIMEMQGGQLLIGDAEELDLPHSITGAVIVLKFKGQGNV